MSGRFAPSPTGPLHMGSLITAVASYLECKQRGELWHIRIDDIDPPRALAGAESRIIASLAAHGLLSDGPITYQSNRLAHYRSAIKRLRNDLFYCTCSRKQTRNQSIYPGTCRSQRQQIDDAALRVEVSGSLTVNDELRGQLTLDLASDHGDFIVRRRDGLVAYNLATAVDDGCPDITQVVRGDDLFDVTAPQLYLIAKLGLTPPRYAHLPTLRFGDGTKLSKQTHAPPLENNHAANNLYEALRYLGLPVTTAQHKSAKAWLAWALPHWDIQRLPERLTPYQHPSPKT